MKADLKIFCDGIDDTALQQVKALAEFEAYKDSKIRIMPDAHAGIGCTIGTTMTLTDKATPNLVALATSFTRRWAVSISPRSTATRFPCQVRRAIC